MSETPFFKMRTIPLQDVMARAALTGDSATLVQDDADIGAAIDRLEAGGFGNDAAKLMAHALPRRESVWWACMCAHHTEPDNLPDVDRAAVAAAEQWVRNQADETRREAFDKAQQAGFGTAEAWAAVAAFWSGDSMSPLGQPKTPPAPHLTGTAVIGSVVLAAVRAYPERRDDRMRRFLASGREIASGGAGRLDHEDAP